MAAAAVRVPSPGSRGVLTVLFASQTGTAADLAERVARSARRRGFEAAATALDDFDLAQLPEQRYLVWLVATTGDGEMPDNGRRAWSFLLRRDLPADALAATRCAVFGLGDSSYAKFNAAARRLSTRLAQLGAVPMCARGLGDDQSAQGVEGDFAAWTGGQLWPALDGLAPPPAGAVYSDAPAWSPPTFAVHPLPASLPAAPVDVAVLLRRPWSALMRPVADTYVPKDDSAVAGSEGLPFLATVTDNRRLTASAWRQDVRHVELDVAHTAIVHEPGDVAVLYPRNDALSVRRLAARLLVGARPAASSREEEDAADDTAVTALLATHVSIAYAAQPKPGVARATDARLAEPLWNALPRESDAGATAATATGVAPPSSPLLPLPPSPVTVGHILSRWLDIGGTPRRGFLEQLAFYAGDEEQREKLLELASPAGTDLYHSYIVQERRTYVDVLEDFHSVTLPVAALLDLVPPLLPRAFSIASAAAMVPGRVQLCVAVVEYRTRLGREKRGVASSWIASDDCGVGSAVAMHIRRGTFGAALRESSAAYGRPSTLILVGPGTGIAPMRALVQDAVVRHGAGAAIPRIHLFAGCRRADSDWLYHDELAGYAAEVAKGGASTSALATYDTAFSRDATPRCYVQDRMRAHAAALVPPLLHAASTDDTSGDGDGGACLLISGSAKRMPTDVVAATRDMLAAAFAAEVGADGGGDSAARAARAIAVLERRRRILIEAWS